MMPMRRPPNMPASSAGLLIRSRSVRLVSRVVVELERAGGGDRGGSWSLLDLFVKSSFLSESATSR
jgi:hypothetical protein